jgi:hypothetical protein
VQVIRLALEVEEGPGEGDSMIESEEELEVVRAQLALAESALDSLRRRVKNKRTFALYSEGPVDQIAELKAQIEAYKKTAKRTGKANG